MNHRFGRHWMFAACALGACATHESRFASNEARYRDEMLERYRPGSEWREPQDRLGNFKSWHLAAPAPDGFAEAALAEARAHGADPRSCWWGFVARQTIGTSVGSVGMFVDYVFVDSEGRMVVAYRRFLD